METELARVGIMVTYNSLARSGRAVFGLAASGSRRRARWNLPISCYLSNRRSITSTLECDAPESSAGGSSTFLASTVPSARSGPVRLPLPVHHSRVALGALTYPGAPSPAGVTISRLASEVFPYVQRSSERPGSRVPRDLLRRSLPFAYSYNAGIPHAAPHDSAPRWVARPLKVSVLHSLQLAGLAPA
jgi:hypothetical protein